MSSVSPALEAETRPVVRRRGASFVVAAVLLLAAGLGLNWWMMAANVYLKKEPVPMRVSFGAPEFVSGRVLGTWVRVMDDVLDHEVEAALGAYAHDGVNDYRFCSFINATIVGRSTDDLLKEFQSLGYEQKQRRLAEYIRDFPHAVVRVGLSYYTGKADTVAHIPERCFIAEGYDIVNDSEERWDLGHRILEVRHLQFADQRERSALPACNVAYCFHVNGQFMNNSLEVRRALQNLFARYAYYAKIELRCDNTARETSATAMKDLLKVLLPEIEKALPDWEQYKGK